MPRWLPSFLPDHLTDRQLMASMRRTEKETRRAIALSLEMIAATRKRIAEIDTDGS